MGDTGYVRLTVVELESTTLCHLVSGLDEDTPPCSADGALPTSISGYTEWISAGKLVVTVGWDWVMLTDSGPVRLARVGCPSSNIMLQTPSRCDLGPATTSQLLASFVDGFDWQSETLRRIGVRYTIN